MGLIFHGFERLRRIAPGLPRYYHRSTVLLYYLLPKQIWAAELEFDFELPVLRAPKIVTSECLEYRRINCKLC